MTSDKQQDQQERSPEDMIRLQKYLARAGVASRRASEALIEQGRVKVNGQVVTELGRKVHPVHDEVRLDDAVVAPEVRAVTLMLHKPAGYLTSMKDDRGRKCVSELVPCDEYRGLFPIGRLDLDTTGLLLFSTDGELGNALLHPSRHVDKTYHAWVKGRPEKRALDRLRKGVRLEDGMTAPAQVKVIDEHQRETLLRIVIHEGRKRQVKRMCEAVGHPVVSLHRERFGPLALGDLSQGLYRLLSDAEVAALQACAK